MRKTSLILLISLGMASAAYAQSSVGGITMSTDPAKAAAVERHAQELKARPATQTEVKAATASAGSHHAKAHSTQHHSTAKKPAAK